MILFIEGNFYELRSHVVKELRHMILFLGGKVLYI